MCLCVCVHSGRLCARMFGAFLTDSKHASLSHTLSLCICTLAVCDLIIPINILPITLQNFATFFSLLRQELQSRLHKLKVHDNISSQIWFPYDLVYAAEKCNNMQTRSVANQINKSKVTPQQLD